MPVAPVSVCLIVRDDASSGIYEECLQSIKPHVAELIIVDTGSKDGTQEISKRYATKHEEYTGCNDPATGFIASFSDARKKSFELATQSWVMWMDSDDVLAGGEQLHALIAFANEKRGASDWCYLFPYEYAYNHLGQCTCLHYRERLVSSRDAMAWQSPVHEVLVPVPGRNLILAPCDDVIYKHQRQRSKKLVEGGRNLRILQKLVEQDGSKDARQFYYLGLEYANSNQLDKAIEWLTKYTAVSGWDDEKAMAYLKLSQLAYQRNDLQEGIRWGFKAIETHETWAEGYFALARGFHSLAWQGGAAEAANWRKCAHFAKVGLDLPPTKTMLFINPMERAHEIHIYYNMALNKLGDVAGALDSASKGLAAVPTDGNLALNKKLYEAYIAKTDAIAAIDRLATAEGITPDLRESLKAQLIGAPAAPPGTQISAWKDYAPPATYPKGVKEEHFPVAVVTPHARAWGIPESRELNGLPLVITAAQLQAMTVAIWKEYMNHDEVMAAERFLADAPYRIKHSVDTQKALAMTRGTMAWMSDKAETQRINQPADMTIENGVPLPGLLNGALLGRSELVLRTLTKEEKILDLGCFDGGITNRWGLAGYKVEALDLCQSSVALANRKAAEFNTGVKHHVGYFHEGPLLLGNHVFDVVTCCDTYEHVKDPVADLLKPAREMVKDSGRMVVVTPHGAWMRGAFVSWAHPWRWADEKNAPWNAPIERAHLVAPTVWTVAENFRKAGFWVKDSFVVECDVKDVPGQGNVYCEGLATRPVAYADPLDIVFACGDAWQAWNPEIARKEGIGGSETAVVHMAKELVALGHRVRVYTSTGAWGEGIFDGVEYRQSDKLQLVKECDVLVAWRNLSILDFPIEAKKRLLWVHDIFAVGGGNSQILKADHVLGLSDWHCDFLQKHHNINHTTKTRNGIDLTRFDQVVERNPHKVVSSSSPDRSLASLLSIWPAVRAVVPDAELHVFYGFFNWKSMAQATNNTEHLGIIAWLEQQMESLKDKGVFFRDKVNQRDLAKEFLSAGVWAYPTWFTETSCITAMEAQAAGCRIVTSAIAALNETVGPRGVLLDHNEPNAWLGADYQSRFAEALISALLAPDNGDRAALQAHARANFGWKTLAVEWEALMRQDTAVLIPYCPRKEFARCA